MNFSEWRIASMRARVAIAYLTAICAGVQQDRIAIAEIPPPASNVRWTARQANALFLDFC
jgi:hypothetical protein